jgi:hypothetical protein
MSYAALQAIARAVSKRRISAADWRLLACVRVMQAVALAAVTWAPIPAVRRRLARLRPVALACAGSVSERRVLWAIDTSARWHAATSTCLARALAADWLLGSVDAPLTIVIGVTRPGGGGMHAHAWVERDGCVILGGADARQAYLPFVAWDGRQE